MTTVWVVYMDDYWWPSAIEHRICGVTKSRELAIALARKTIAEDITFTRLDDIEAQDFEQVDLDATTIVFEVRGRRAKRISVHLRLVQMQVE